MITLPYIAFVEEVIRAFEQENLPIHLGFLAIGLTENQLILVRDLSELDKLLKDDYICFLYNKNELVYPFIIKVKSDNKNGYYEILTNAQLKSHKQKLERDKLSIEESLDTLNNHF